MDLEQIFVSARAALASIGGNEKLAVDTHKGMKRTLSEDTLTNKLEKKNIFLTMVNTQHFKKLVIDGIAVYTYERFIEHNAVYKISHLKKRLSIGKEPPDIASKYSVKKHRRGLNFAKLRIQNLMRGMKIVALTSLITMVPGVDASNNFDLRKTIPAVYSQLAQNAVITSFGVLCASKGDRSPLDALADGPLSSISSAVWLWRMRKVKEEDTPVVRLTDLQVARIIVPGGPIKQLVLDSIPAISIASASFIIYLLSFLESSEWKWALTVSAGGLASEGCRLLATWLATTALQKEFFIPDDLVNGHTGLYLTNEAEKRPFIECKDGKIQPLRHWQKFTNTSAAVKCTMLGQVHYSWRWVNVKHAILSLLFFCISAVFAIFSTGALVASTDSSLSGGFLSFVICYCAGGKWENGTPAESLHPDMYHALVAARRLYALSKHIALDETSALKAGEFVFYSLMTTSDIVTYKGKKYRAYKPGPGGLVDMHDVYQRYARLNSNINKAFNIVEDDTGRSTMIEIADALYCRSLLLVRHAHKCRSRQPSVRGQVCNADTADLLSALLLVSDHVECQDVCGILNEIKAWMNDEYLLWSIIGSYVTLEMMVLPYLRKQLQSSNTLDLALRICHMSIFETVPTENLLEAVPIALYLLLTGNTVLGHATARVVERAIVKFNAASIIPDLDEVILSVDDRYTIQCKGQLHPWPGGFIPILTQEAVTNQPANYTLARAVFNPMLNRQTLTQQDETLYISSFPTY
ncbi:hypothetical protein INT44_007826 [Umbelopsis vinacea]|uniref:Uncharacterized protein n=1 Tax=Umbelopsis vinacea TaxID=44442 RepID=A0A8H7PJW3_9FUNG|nr:hypothetical protein INT44_007826 [Umbelopsis vinacea]